MLAIVLLSSLRAAGADMAYCMPTPAPFSLIECNHLPHVVIARYRDDASASPYSTELDRRNVVIVEAKRNEKVAAGALSNWVTHLLFVPEKGGALGLCHGVRCGDHCQG